MTIERHYLNGDFISAIQIGPDVSLEEFLEDYKHKLSDTRLHDWIDGLDQGMWLVKRESLLVEMQNEAYQALFHGKW